MEKYLVKFPGDQFNIDTGNYDELEGSIVSFSENCEHVVVLSCDTSKFYKIHINDLTYVKVLKYEV